MLTDTCTSEAAAIAWPETPVRRVGVWYDTLTTWMGICKNNYYKAGHAALVLADREAAVFRYFDFGRYHTPHQYGRVRSQITDPELHIPIQPKWDNNNRITNWQTVLEWLNTHKACHGEGRLYAGVYYGVSYLQAQQAIANMQKSQLIQYGPFVAGGSNCSRFVRDIIAKSLPWGIKKLMLYLPPMLTPTTRWNTVPANHKYIIHAFTVIHTKEDESKSVSLA
jgi:hypothetical protein